LKLKLQSSGLILSFRGVWIIKLKAQGSSERNSTAGEFFLQNRFSCSYIYKTHGQREALQRIFTEIRATVFVRKKLPPAAVIHAERALRDYFMLRLKTV
jgi:hypothetical protein